MEIGINALHRVPEIMCTLTVSQICHCEALVRSMADAGMASVRINTAHLDGVEQLGMLARRLKAMIPGVRILIDTKGPEMRTTSVSGDGTLRLDEGMTIEFEGADADLPSTTSIVYVNYSGLHSDVAVGDELLIDDGRIALAVDSVAGSRIKATVTRGGDLGSRKGLSVSGKDVDLPAVSQHDREYIAFASTSPYIDWIAHSFVRSADDVRAVKAAMDAAGKPVMAKIESQQGIDNLQDICGVAEGILIARGDLTASIGRENIPAAQQYIAEVAKRRQLPLCLATNILPSMMYGDSPSADDIERIAVAVTQGIDIMLLTNETASGSRPLQSVVALKQIMENL